MPGILTLSRIQDMTDFGDALTWSSIQTFSSYLKTDQILDSNGNESLKFVKVSSALNEVTIKNSATGNPPRVLSTGGDSNISLILQSKGTGNVQIRGEESGGTATLDFWNTFGGFLQGSFTASAWSGGVGQPFSLTPYTHDVDVSESTNAGTYKFNLNNLQLRVHVGGTTKFAVAVDGTIRTNQTATATVAVGVLAAKLPVYDVSGSLVGYAPLYSTIT